MNRRGFLRGLAAWAAAPVILPALPSVLIASPVVRVITGGGYSPASNLSNLPNLTTVYYDKPFIRNLKAQTPFFKMSQVRSLPSVEYDLTEDFEVEDQSSESKKVQFFMYQPLHAELTNV